MSYWIISVLLGLLPEVLYFTLFLIYVKNIKEKKIKLFILISIAYFVCALIYNYKTLYYIGFIVSIYIILKILYKEKTQIIDIFIISIPMSFIFVISFICYLFVKNDLSNYYLLYIIDRIVLYSTLIFKNKLNLAYKKYCKLWNRNDKMKRPLKSITLRNISLMSINFIIFFMNLYILKIS